jgi:hypothetical protein
MKRTYWLILGAILLVIAASSVTWYITTQMTTKPSSVATSTASIATTTTPAPTSAKVSENTQYYSVDLAYPLTTPLAQSAGAQADANAVAALKAYADTSKSTFVSDGNFSSMTPERFAYQGGRQEALSDKYKMYSGSDTISYVFDTYADTGGAHPNSYYKTFTFDSKTGAQLMLGNLFVNNSGYLEKLSTISRTQLSVGQDGDNSGAGSMMLDGTTPIASNFQNFYIDGTNLVILFDPYQVASYAAGPQQVSVPLSELNDILQSGYK